MNQLNFFLNLFTPMKTYLVIIMLTSCIFIVLIAVSNLTKTNQGPMRKI